MDDLLRATARAEERHFWFRGFRWFVRPLVRQALAGTSRARVLDCGCGTGANLALLGHYGAAFGFDTSAVGLEIARFRDQGGLARASTAAIPFRDGCFDLVTSFDVLYALDDEDEHAAVREIFRVTRPGGWAVVSVAAMDVLRGDHSVLSHEVRRYSKSSLYGLLAEAGFRIERLTYTNCALFLPLVVLRTFHRWRGLANEADADREIAVPFAPVNALLSAALFLESVWLRRLNLPYGSSLLCLARKPEDARPRRAD